MLGKFKSSVANRIIFWIIVFSLAVSATATTIQLYLEYSGQIEGLKQQLSTLERSYLSSVRRALWVRDKAQLQMLVDGMQASHDIAYAGVEEDGRILVDAGQKPEDGGVAHQVPVTFEHRRKLLTIGALEIVGDPAAVRERTLGLGLRMLGTNVAITLAVAVFVYFAFSRLVTRHLGAMAEQLGGMGDDLGRVMTLSRPGREGAEGDEFDLLVSAFNALRERLRESQRKVEKGQDELRASERRYRAILDEMLDTYYRTDSEGRVIMVTPSMQDLLGWTPEEAVGRLASEFYAENDHHRRFMEAFRTGGGSVRAFEAAMRHRDGRVIWVSTTARIYRADDGDIAGIEGIARDITEQRTAAETVRSSRNQLRLVADSVPAAILYVDRDLIIRFANREAGQWLKQDVDDLVGTHLDAFSNEAWVERMRALWDTVLAGQAQMIADDFPDISGKSHRLELRLVPHMRYDEGVEGVFALGLDMTERHMLEERLRQSQKMEAVGQLTGGVAHDFNNLLGVILGNAEFLIEEPDLSPEDRMPLLGAIQRAGHRGARLTRQLLAFSRMQPLEPSTLQLGRDLNEFVSMLRPSIGESTTVNVSAEPDLWPCTADRGLLELALLNLTLNARDAMPEGGEVTIALSNADLSDVREAERIGVEPGAYVEIAVSDKGKGIPEELQRQVFEPFFTTKDVGRGTGLGLSMVYGFVSQSGGQVGLESVEGVGTTVRLYLPAALEAVEKAEDTGMERHGICGLRARIMVVEDDADLRRLTAALLDRLGYHVQVAHDGPSAVALLKAGPPPDIVLTDVRLPNGMPGPQVVMEARAIKPDIRAIYMTGFADPDAVASLELRGEDMLIRKPFRSDDLARTLERVRAVHQ